MKKHSIKYKHAKYDGVIYIPFTSESELQELLEIVTIQVGETIPKSFRPAPIDSYTQEIDGYHVSLNIEVSHTLYRKFLALTIPTKYLTYEDMIDFNIYAREYFHEEGSYGTVTDNATLEHTIYSTEHSEFFGHDLAPTICSKAARYWYRTAYYQAFSNGNKRTGMIASLNFLDMNYFVIKEDYDNSNLYEEMSLKIANKQLSEYGVRQELKKIVEYDIERSTSDFIERGLTYGR